MFSQSSGPLRKCPADPNLDHAGNGDVQNGTPPIKTPAIAHKRSLCAPAREGDAEVAGGIGAWAGFRSTSSSTVVGFLGSAYVFRGEALAGGIGALSISLPRICGNPTLAGVPHLAISGDFAHRLDVQTSDLPITLEEAARTIFRGAITARVLRRAVDKGELKAFKVGRTIFTTAADVAKMRESCPVEPSPRVYPLIVNEGPGPSGTDHALSARAALQARLERPRRFSENTLASSIGRKQAAHRC